MSVLMYIYRHFNTPVARHQRYTIKGCILEASGISAFCRQLYLLEGTWRVDKGRHVVTEPGDLAWVDRHCNRIGPTFSHPHISEENLHHMLPWS